MAGPDGRCRQLSPCPGSYLTIPNICRNARFLVRQRRRWLYPAESCLLDKTESFVGGADTVGAEPNVFGGRL